MKRDRPGFLHDPLTPGERLLLPEMSVVLALGHGVYQNDPGLLS